MARMEQTLESTWKRVLKCGFSFLVFLFDKTQTLLKSAVGVTSMGRCVVLYYHSVPAEERELFASQLDVLKRRSQLIRSDKYTVAQRNCAAVTFDDGFENFLTQALPELEKRNIPATVFVIADGIDREFGPENHSEKLLSLEQLLNLPRDLVSLGSHTLTHPLLTKLEEPEARREIRESRVKLEALLSRPVTEFSFPFGGFNEDLVGFARDAGYDRVYTTLPAFAFHPEGEFVVGRIRVDPTDWPLEFRLKVAGAYRWLPMIFALKRKLVALAGRFMAAPADEHSMSRSSVR